MSQDDHFINGELLRLGREARGWVIGDMATRACMSIKQIRQLEEGGTSAFYSPAVKMTSAKKLAGILELSPEQVFNRPKSAEVDFASSQDVVPELAPTGDQPVAPEDLAHAQAEAVIETPESVEAPVSAPVLDEPKSKTSLLAIAALFVAAIGVAGYLKQQEEPVTEPPPPLQVMPAEVEPAASAADAASSPVSTASTASDTPAAPAASAPALPASSVLPVVAAPPATPKPAASAASKPL